MPLISTKTVLLVSLFYFTLLFLVAYYADRRKQAGQSLLTNSRIYTLSLAVYCTSWTFYGSVGRAATSGLEFLPIYLGPTLIAFTWWFLLRKMVRISKQQNITSIADFISSRYDRSAILGALITCFAVFGITPYIALQLKAISQTLDILSTPLANPGAALGKYSSVLPTGIDTAFFVALILALFGMLFAPATLIRQNAMKVWLLRLRSNRWSSWLHLSRSVFLSPTACSMASEIFFNAFSNSFPNVATCSASEPNRRLTPNGLPSSSSP